MENEYLIIKLASELQSVKKSDLNILSIPVDILNILNKLIKKHDTKSDTFYNPKESSNNKKEFLVKLYFLYHFITTTKTLKIFFQYNSIHNEIDLFYFKNLNILELQGIDLTQIRNIKPLQLKLKKIVCNRCLNTLKDILNPDNDSDNFWYELKEIHFTSNMLTEFNHNFELTPWLTILDLSYNQLKNVEPINCLTNLNFLNLSHNKLTSVPDFKGVIRIQLKNLILNNNFLENLNGLQNLVNIIVLDLGSNCLINHKCLVSLSHLDTLQWLNLNNNPLSFHPNHKILAASYLNLNIPYKSFILDGLSLDKSQKKVIGTFHPKFKNKYSLSSNSNNINLSFEKSHKVRYVMIEDENNKIQNNVASSSSLTPSSSTSSFIQHLQTKKQIEYLRKEFGDSWLSNRNGLDVKNVLGYNLANEKLSIQSTSYSDNLDNTTEIKTDQPIENVSNCEEQTFMTAFDTSDNDNKTQSLEESNIYEDENYNNDDDDNDGDDDDDYNDDDDDDDDDDVDLSDEEHIYIATPEGEDNEIFLVITKTYISEKECSTSKERIRWQINSISNCQQIDEKPTKVQLEFDTIRKDRKQRIYNMELSELNRFISCIKECMELQTPKLSTVYQCLKCSEQFYSKNDNKLRDIEISCPKCKSTIIVESE